MKRFYFWISGSLIFSLSFFFWASHLEASSFVLGKQYKLKQKRKKGSLVWHSVTFGKSVTGEFKISLEVYSAKGKSLEFLDDYLNFVSEGIAQRCISKFTMINHKVNFDNQKKAIVSFQTPSMGQVMYLPLKVKYDDGFEDYIIRVRIINGKFAISSRPLQQGKLQQLSSKDLEKLRAERQRKQQEERRKKEKLAQEEEKKRKAEEQRKEALEKEGIQVNEELLKSEPSGDENFDPLNSSPAPEGSVVEEEQEPQVSEDSAPLENEETFDEETFDEETFDEEQKIIRVTRYPQKTILEMNLLIWMSLQKKMLKMMGKILKV